MHPYVDFAYSVGLVLSFQENQSPSKVELKSFKQLKKANGEITAGKTTSGPSPDKTGSKIGELAGLVFGSERDQNKENLSKTSTVTPVRHTVCERLLL